MSKHRTKNNMYVRSIQSTSNRIINILVGLGVLSIGIFIWIINNMAMRMTQMTMEKALSSVESAILVLIFQVILRCKRFSGYQNPPAKKIYQ